MKRVPNHLARTVASWYILRYLCIHALMESSWSYMNDVWGFGKLVSKYINEKQGIIAHNGSQPKQIAAFQYNYASLLNSCDFLPYL